jgi:hypothetical protein
VAVRDAPTDQKCDGRRRGQFRRVKITETNAIDDLAPGLDRPLVATIERAIDPDRSRRFESAREMEHALAESLAPPSASIGKRTSSAKTAATGLFGRAQLTVASLVVLTASMLLVAPVRDWLTRRASPPGSRGDMPAAAVTQTRGLSRVPAPDEYQFLGRPSPDGRAYTFTDMDGNLAVFDPTTGVRQQLTDKRVSNGNTYMSAPFSADGRFIAYSWEVTPDQWELRVMPAAGGDPRVVWRSGPLIVHPLQWSPDGARLLVMLERRDGDRHLAVTSLADGSSTRIAAVDSSHTAASLSPDGRVLLSLAMATTSLHSGRRTGPA